MKCRVEGCPDESLPDKLRCQAHASPGSGQMPSATPVPPGPKAILDSVSLLSLSDEELMDHMGRVSSELARRNRSRLPGAADSVKAIREVFAQAMGRKDPRSD